MAIEFDKNIPIPDPVVRTKYDFDLMEVGDSKFWPGSAVSKAVAVFCRKSPKRFTARTLTERDPESGAMVRGTRVWRTM